MSQDMLHINGRAVFWCMQVQVSDKVEVKQYSAHSADPQMISMLPN